MGHTPGPWLYKRTHHLSGDQWYVITDNDGFGPIMEVGGKTLPGQIAEVKYLVTDPNTIEANARLIAAAPDLLAALEQTMKVLRNLRDNCQPEWDSIVTAELMNAWDANKAAIAKATQGRHT